MAEGETKRALIVDDDLSVLQADAGGIAEHSSLGSRYFSEARNMALNSPSKNTYDLMIFDFSMPMIDGALLFELISKVYENQLAPAAHAALTACFRSGFG